MPHIPIEYFIGTGLAMLASIVGTLGVIYKKKDDDDQISKGEIVYIVLRGILAGIVGVNLGMLVFQTHTFGNPSGINAREVLRRFSQLR